MDLGKVWAYDPCCCWYFSDPLWLSYTCDFKKLHRLFHMLKKHCCDQPKRPASRLCLLVPCSTKAQKVAFSKTYHRIETHKELSQGASQHAGSGYEISALLWVGWLGQVTLSKSITWWARRASDMAVIVPACSLFYPWTLGKWPHLDEKLSSVKWR